MPWGYFAEPGGAWSVLKGRITMVPEHGRALTRAGRRSWGTISSFTRTNGTIKNDPIVLKEKWLKVWTVLKGLKHSWQRTERKGWNRSLTNNTKNGMERDERNITGRNGTIEKKTEWERNNLAEGPRSRTERNDFQKVGPCPALVLTEVKFKLTVDQSVLNK